MSSYPTPFPSNNACGFGDDRYGYWQDLVLSGVTTRFRWVGPDEFMMGSPSKERGRLNNETLHNVRISSGYWLAETACTQKLWQAVTGQNPSEFKGDDRPVESISWEDIQQLFIEPLKQQMTDLQPTLPTEAQWEFACRAGTETAFSWGDELDESLANYIGEWEIESFNDLMKKIDKRRDSGETTVVVSKFQPNSWGFYQMHGNVWEWCLDWRAEYPRSTVLDPSGSDTAPEEGERVLRGGSWRVNGRFLRSASRSGYSPGLRYDDFGFRLAQVPVSPAAEPGTRSV